MVHIAKQFHRFNRITKTIVILCLLLSSACFYGCLNNARPHAEISNNLEDLEFPLAFSILVHTNVDRAIRLLRAIYRPQNVYCIHVDLKTPHDDYIQLKVASEQFANNVYLVPDEQRISVRWGRISVLEADLICARVLLFEIGREHKWKYWINLTGQEFPLRTNWELVTALKALNGTNLVEAMFERHTRAFKPYPKCVSFDLIWYKGPVHVALRREFVHFMLTDKQALEVYECLKQFQKRRSRPIVADETYFATLNHNPNVFKVAGTSLGPHTASPNDGVIRYKIWRNQNKYCGSRIWLRTICILGLKDVTHLRVSRSFFANKFLPHIQPRGYDLLENWIYKKVVHEITHDELHPSFDLDFYRNSPIAKNHL